MKQKIALGARLLMGLLFLVFGLNGFLQFIPVPPPSEAAGNFLGALFQTGYMFPIIKSVEVLVGVLLLANVFVPLALLLITPIIVNIVLLHIILDPAGIATSIVLLVLHSILTIAYMPYFKLILVKKTESFKA